MQQEIQNLKKLLNALGNPQDKLKVIHIAGTNGKGSCGLLLSTLLNHSKSKSSRNCPTVGWFHSPSLEKDQDILINLRKIPESKLEQFTASATVTNFQVSAFEKRVVIAILAFIEMKCELCIFECGMGGLNDATNIFNFKELAIITKIGYDHQGFLGNTLADITIHKLGIIQNSSQSIMAIDQYPEVLTVVSSMQLLANELQLISSASLIEASKYSFSWQYKNVTFSSKLLGIHQGINMGLVIEATMRLTDYEFDYSVANNAVWPGRLQYVPYKSKNILFDGSHNSDSILALRKYLDEFLSEQLIILFCCSGKNKNAEELLDILTIGRNDTVYLSSFKIPEDMPWVTTTPLDNYGKYQHLDLCEIEAISSLIGISNAQVLVCGSLYFIHDIFMSLSIGLSFTN